MLFLDEVSELTHASQAKLLRVLEQREFLRLGGTRIVKADIRVIGATNRDLWKAVDCGAFRADLYYRLQVFEILIPPLRERRDDILPLADAMVVEIGRSLERPPAGLTWRAKQALLRDPWPGNVRELRNALERAAILCQGGLIDVEHLAPHGTRCSVPQTNAARTAATTDLNTIERQMIARVLGECCWNKAQAARRLGLSRTQLHVRIHRYGLEYPQSA